MIKTNLPGPQGAYLAAFGLLLALSACQNGGLAGAADDKIKSLIKSSGLVELELVEAHVPDLDPLPMQRDSDVFVRVYLNDTKELLCETQVIQDANKPKVSDRSRTLLLPLFISIFFFFCWAEFRRKIQLCCRR